MGQTRLRNSAAHCSMKHDVDKLIIYEHWQSNSTVPVYLSLVLMVVKNIV